MHRAVYFRKCAIFPHRIIYVFVTYSSFSYYIFVVALAGATIGQLTRSNQQSTNCFGRATSNDDNEFWRNLLCNSRIIIQKNNSFKSPKKLEDESVFCSMGTVPSNANAAEQISAS